VAGLVPASQQDNPDCPTSKVGHKKGEWDRLTWMFYDHSYVLQEAWAFDAETLGYSPKKSGSIQTT
jgi:hypothetical protein